MQEIGRIKQIQVQRSRLKPGQKTERYYDPAPLLIVNSLLLSTKGVIGVTADGEQIIDVHNVDHPESRNSNGYNGISIGFTSHYKAMRRHFGDHLMDGIAGENILVEVDDQQSINDLERGVMIQISATGQMVYLQDLMEAAPCVEFSRFAVTGITGRVPELANEQVKEALQFLNLGRRGFYATLADSHELVAIQAGDRVFRDN
ncbi:MAG TPA: hypothetical protein VFB12_26580 [Ktedonobacteraceae bacterium]|nr:hypothetical protein [Ktedonobacteraceae bacterium]